MYLNILEKMVLARIIENLEGIEIGYCSGVLEIVNKIFSYEIKQDAILGEYDSKVWISQNFIDLCDYMQDVDGYINLADPFIEPSKFMLQAVLYISKQLLYNYYYPYITSDDLIRRIKEGV